MKINLEWLNEYLPCGRDIQAAGVFADALTKAGLATENIEQHGDNCVIDVEVTSNRPDCLSHIGIARELSALLGQKLKFPPLSAPQTSSPASTVTSIAIEAADVCPHYTARVLRNIRVGPSPDWMVRRLEAVGVRSINNVVDITNYVLLEMGQPLHAFDFDKLIGRRIIVRHARDGEKIVSIDGHERQLNSRMLVIADENSAVALAGIMGGRDTEVAQGTTNILLESARFDPLVVRKTARLLAMQSDASYRFERGIEPTLPVTASLRAAGLILKLAGGELMEGAVEAGCNSYAPKRLSLRLAKLKQVMGLEIPAELAVDCLGRLGFTPKLESDRIEVVVPCWRLDVNLEVDLVEEVARLIGYDKIPVRDKISIQVVPLEPSARAIDRVRSVLVAAGYYESVTFSFVSDALCGDFRPAEAAGLAVAEPGTRKADAHLRPSILPGLLESAGRNQSVGTVDARLFEIGSVFWVESASGIVERRRLGIVGSADLREVRGVVEAVLGALDANRQVTIVPGQRNGFARGTGGGIEWGGQVVGFMGMIDHAIADKLSLRQLPAAAELEITPLLAGAQHVPQLRPLPRFPAVRRDLSVILPESTAYQRLETLIRDLHPTALEAVEYVTTYRGKPLEKGVKSVTVTLVFRSSDGTLTGEAVEASVRGVVDAIGSKLNGTLRE